MDPDEFEEYLASLPPEEQAQVLREMGMGQASMMPPSFAGPFAPALSPGSYDLSMMNQLPPDIEYGDVQPFGLDELSQAYNIQQDFGALSLDPALAMYAGRGAFDPKAFEPTIVPIGEPLDLSGTRYVSAMAQAGGGYESYLANKIANEGMTPGGAVADMWAKITAGGAPDAPPEVKAERDALVASLPPNTSTDPMVQAQGIDLAGDFSTPQGQMASANVDAITATANDLFYKMTSDPAIGYTDPATGLPYAGAQEEPSELAAKFREYGLPLPTESYTDPQWLTSQLPQESAMAREAANQAGEAAVGAAGGIRDLTQANLDELTKAWEASAPQRAAAIQPGAEPQRSDFTQPVLSPEANADINAEWAKAYEDWETAPRGEAPSLRDFYEGKPLPRFAAAAANLADYEKAYGDWEAETKAAADQGTGAPYVVSRNGEILDTYDFGEHPELGRTTASRNAIGKLMGVIGQFGKLGGGSGSGVQVGQMSPGFLSQYQGGLADAEQQYRDAQFWQEDLDQRRYPGESEYATSLGQAMAMSDMGRTPLQDMLMQRTIQRQSMMPYTYQGYMG